MIFDKEKNRFILEREELAILSDVPSSVRAVSREYPSILDDLKQELENADRVLKTLPEHWWAESKLMDEEKKDDEDKKDEVDDKKELKKD